MRIEARWRETNPLRRHSQSLPRPHLTACTGDTAVRLDTGFQCGGKGGEELALQIVHAATVQTVCFGVFANGTSLKKTFLKVIVVIPQDGLSAVTQEQQAFLENQKI